MKHRRTRRCPFCRRDLPGSPARMEYEMCPSCAALMDPPAARAMFAGPGVVRRRVNSSMKLGCLVVGAAMLAAFAMCGYVLYDTVAHQRAEPRLELVLMVPGVVVVTLVGLALVAWLRARASRGSIVDGTATVHAVRFVRLATSTLQQGHQIVWEVCAVLEAPGHPPRHVVDRPLLLGECAGLLRLGSRLPAKLHATNRARFAIVYPVPG